MGIRSKCLFNDFTSLGPPVVHMELRLGLANAEW